MSGDPGNNKSRRMTGQACARFSTAAANRAAETQSCLDTADRKISTLARNSIWQGKTNKLTNWYLLSSVEIACTSVLLLIVEPFEEGRWNARLAWSMPISRQIAPENIGNPSNRRLGRKIASILTATARKDCRSNCLLDR